MPAKAHLLKAWRPWQRPGSTLRTRWSHPYKRTAEDKGLAIVDIFRLENDKLVEHWDVVQPIPEEAKNNHPMF